MNTKMNMGRRELLLNAGVVGALSAMQTSNISAAETSPTSSPSTEPKPKVPSSFAPNKSKIFDVHTHMYSNSWVDAVHASKDPNFQLGTGADEGSLIYRGASIGRIVPAMLDFDIRIKAMDEAKVDVALISLTAPNVYWGNRAQSAQAARAINDSYAAAQRKYDGRIRWFASLPFQHADDAIEEARRAKKNGAIGICTLTNILGKPLTSPEFKPIWRELDAMRMPVFVHPTTPFVDGMGLNEYGLFNSIGFTSESSACFARMMFEGFFDEFPNLSFIACHGGGALPYLFARFDIMWERYDTGKIKSPPSSYRKRFYYDSIVYDQNTLEFLIKQVGHDRVMYGSDYPFRIGDMKGVMSRVDALPVEQRDAIRGGNAMKLFDF